MNREFKSGVGEIVSEFNGFIIDSNANKEDLVVGFMRGLCELLERLRIELGLSDFEDANCLNEDGLLGVANLLDLSKDTNLKAAATLVSAYIVWCIENGCSVFWLLDRVQGSGGGFVNSGDAKMKNLFDVLKKRVEKFVIDNKDKVAIENKK